jgi:hypothetical protein
MLRWLVEPRARSLVVQRIVWVRKRQRNWLAARNGPDVSPGRRSGLGPTNLLFLGSREIPEPGASPLLLNGDRILEEDDLIWLEDLSGVDVADEQLVLPDRHAASADEQLT